MKVYIKKNTETVAIDNPEAKHYDGSAHSEALSLTYVSLPNCKEVNNWSFYNCSNLTQILLPNVQTLGFGALNSMSGITELYLPKCTYTQQEAIQNNSNLRTIYLPKMEYSNTSTQNSLKNNSSCTYLDISGISAAQWPNGYLNTSAASDTFNNYPQYGRVYFPRYFTTSNGGGLDGDMNVLSGKNWTLIAV